MWPNGPHEKGVPISPRRFKPKVYTTSITIDPNCNLASEAIPHSVRKGEWRRKKPRRESSRTSR